MQNKQRYVLAICVLAVSAQVWPQVIKKDYDHVLALRADKDKFVEAVRAYDKAQTFFIKADQMIAEQYLKENNQAMANAKLKKANERAANVKELYEVALGQFGDSALLHNYYGELLYDRYGNIPGAIMEWNKAISYDSKLSQAYNNLGLHQTHTGDYEMGLYNMKMALELEPDNPDYLFNMAQVYLIHAPQMSELEGVDKSKLYKEAIKMSKKAASLAPNEFELVEDYAVNFFAAENFGVEADWNEAVAAWGAARAVARTDEEKFYTWLNEARVWIELGNSVEAVRCLKESLVIRPQSAVALKLLEEQERTPVIEEPAPANEE